jgi:hypothetical protein
MPEGRGKRREELGWRSIRMRWFCPQVDGLAYQVDGMTGFGTVGSQTLFAGGSRIRTFSPSLVRGLQAVENVDIRGAVIR